MMMNMIPQDKAQTRSVSALPAFAVNAPVTEVTRLPTGLRVASEVSHTTHGGKTCVLRIYTWQPVYGLRARR